MNRREMLQHSALGLGSLALAQLAGGATQSGGVPYLPHFTPKAKRVIFLFMSGGMSHLESFDHKPLLTEMDRKAFPESAMRGQKPLGMSKQQGTFLAQGSRFPFAQHGQSGAWFSDRFPHLAKQADRLCFLKGMTSEAVNHDPAMIFMNSGNQLPGRPSMGAWCGYGLGSENANLPAFVVLVTKKTADQPLSTRLWDSGFLPAEHQGVSLRPGKEPVLYLKNPEGLPESLQRRALDALKEVQQDELARRGEAEIAARIESYEMAFRMQTSVPELTDFSKENPATLASYGPDVEKPGSFARNCLMARRLAQRGSRFIQLYHPGWDHHSVIEKLFKENAEEVDQPSAALLEDLQQHGLLEDTLVVFGSEFGRTAYGQGSFEKNQQGREHHRDAFTFWLAGAGIKPGMTYGETDEFGFHVVDGKVHANDLHATMLHLMGVDHERFTYRFQGRDYRLTNVAGKLIKPILA
jgi:hypothetical protein